MMIRVGTGGRLGRASLATIGFAATAALIAGAVAPAWAGASVDKAKAHHPKTPKKSTGGCSSYQAGHNGVIRTFCSGSAVVKVTVGSSTTTIKGGSCEMSGGYFTVNAGVVIDQTFKGMKPNYFGIDVPPTGTSFSNATLAYTVGGTAGYASSNTGTVAANHKSGTFTGSDLSGKSVSGSFTC